MGETSALAGRRAVARVPATSANLGPGFDAFGLCLGLYDDLAVTTTTSGLAVEISGEGAERVPTDEHHLVVRALRATFDTMGVDQPGLSLASENRIPHGRGLGSSAAAIVAGIRLAQALVPGHGMSEQASLSLAHAIEGHPDNVAACLLGGFTIAWTDDVGARAARLDVDDRIRVAAVVPTEVLSTEAARGLLPREVSHADAAVNAGRSGLLVAALTQQPELLLDATEDRLHQRFRGSAMPRSLRLVEELRAVSVAAVISGAGPTVLAIGTGDVWTRVQPLVPASWQALELNVDPQGAVVHSVSSP